MPVTPFKTFQRLEKNSVSGITKHTNYIYNITIQAVSVGPTKVYLNTQDIRLRRIYFRSTLLIRYFVRTDKVLWDKMADNTAFVPNQINAVSLLSPASILP